MPKRPGSKLPNRGKWHLQNPFFGAKPPFAILEINFDVPRGSVTLSRITTDAMHIHEIDVDKFNGAYQIWGNKGGFEAQIEDDQTLNMSFFGSVETTCRALPIEIKSEHFSDDIAAMSPGDRMAEAINRSLPLLPGDIAEQLKGLLTKESIAMMAGVTAIWAVSHFFGVGEIADVVLLLFGTLALGAQALDVAEELFDFARLARGARSDDGLNEAAGHFARAVSIGGANVVLSVLLGKAPKVFREVYTKGVKSKIPLAPPPEREMAILINNAERGRALPPNRIAQPSGFREYQGPVWDPVKEPMPSTTGKLVYQPQTKFNAKFKNPGVSGNTEWWGDIALKAASSDAKTRTLLHETVHRFFSPRLQILRKLRVQRKAGSCSRSYILRYLEEGFAEMYAAYRFDGNGTLASVLSGLKFPVKNGYVTVTKMANEARGVFQGAFVVGGVTYRVFFSPIFDSDPPPDGVHPSVEASRATRVDAR